MTCDVELLTDRQRQVLAFINGFRQRVQCNPTRAEIAIGFGFASPNAAEDHLRALERHGVIAFRAGSRARGYIVQGEWTEAA